MSDGQRPPRHDKRLGKGLGALLGEYAAPEEPDGREVRTIPLSGIVPNPLQPRREFPEDELAELAASLTENGLLQPVVVRPAPGRPGRFELVAGERRFRAATSLGWADIPALVRDVDDRTLLVLALVENLQREALGPLEEAEGYRALADTFGLTQAEIAQAVGKDRSTVANTLRLLNLPPSVRKLVEGGSLSPGHARALLTLPDPLRAGDLARRAVREGWSVREMERRVKLDSGSPGATRTRARTNGNPAVAAVERALCESLGTRVRLRTPRKGGVGTIEVSYSSDDDLERLFVMLTGREVSEVLG